MRVDQKQKNYPDMHYGQGMMNEEIERARKRAEAASSRAGSGRSYCSPLGAGFSFDERRPLKEQMNPYSRKGKRQHDDVVGDGGAGGFRIVYEEAYINMNGSTDLNGGGGGARQRPTSGNKEYVVERMKDRRKDRVRQRGEPNPYRRRHDASTGRGRADDNDARSSGCVVM